MGNVHPVVTILGVIVGLNLFGFIGLVFGPLLISYIVLLFNVYMNEFIEAPVPSRPRMAEEVNDDIEAGE
jgi:predicted PurR-regulated permease PerM